MNEHLNTNGTQMTRMLCNTGFTRIFNPRLSAFENPCYQRAKK